MAKSSIDHLPPCPTQEVIDGGEVRLLRQSRVLKRLLELPGNVVQMDFLETHPLIRSLDAYRIVPTENLNPNPNP